LVKILRIYFDIRQNVYKYQTLGYKGDTTLRILTLSIMTFSIVMLSIMTLSITMLSIMTFSIMMLSKMTHSIKTNKM
jgi:hypothetical protein